ncbi:MAG: DNA polymerase III subunit beta [Nannocystaceae bacterium]|nr:DNA polymerase III subunit beta [Nannocystaceae bacterium]
MEFEIDQARFLAALALAQTVADKRSTMPVLANVLLRATADGHVVCSATDMMTSITERIPAEVKSPGSLTVGVRHLHGVVKTLPTGVFTFKGLDNHWAQILAGKSEFKLMGMPETEFPELPDASKAKGAKAPSFTTIAGHVLSDLIQKTQFSVSTDEARVNLNGVLLECDGTTAVMVSTDGHRLTKYECPMNGPTLEKGIIIPRKGMLEIRRVLDRVPGEVELGIGEQHLFLRAGELSLSVKLNNVMFPPYNQVIPTNHQRRVIVPRGELLAALRRAEVMAPEKTATVRLALSEGKLELTADNPDLGIAHQELGVDYTGEELVAGFNARYLMEVLEVIDGDEVALEFQGELDPCVCKPVDGPDFLGVVMPMRI